jgi:hypothetical protein
MQININPEITPDNMHHQNRIRHYRSGMMRYIITVLIFQQIFISALFSQTKPTNSINKNMSVYGLKIRSVSTIKDPVKKSSNGVMIELEKTVPGIFSKFYWKVVYFNAKNKQIFDTTLMQDYPYPYMKPIHVMVSDEDPTDTLMRLYSPEQEREMKELAKKSDEQKIYKASLMYWPKNATHVRVGLTMITFGFSTYYAPGH